MLLKSDLPARIAARTLQGRVTYERPRPSGAFSRITAYMEPGGQAVLGPLLTTKGLNRHSWADEADCDPNSLYRYWRGERGLSTENQLKLATVLGVAPDDLPR